MRFTRSWNVFNVFCWQFATAQRDLKSAETEKLAQHSAWSRPTQRRPAKKNKLKLVTPIRPRETRSPSSLLVCECSRPRRRARGSELAFSWILLWSHGTRELRCWTLVPLYTELLSKSPQWSSIASNSLKSERLKCSNADPTIRKDPRKQNRRLLGQFCTENIFHWHVHTQIPASKKTLFPCRGWVSTKMTTFNRLRVA